MSRAVTDSFCTVSSSDSCSITSISLLRSVEDRETESAWRCCNFWGRNQKVRSYNIRDPEKWNHCSPAADPLIAPLHPEKPSFRLDWGLQSFREQCCHLTSWRWLHEMLKSGMRFRFKGSASVSHKHESQTDRTGFSSLLSVDTMCDAASDGALSFLLEVTSVQW